MTTKDATEKKEVELLLRAGIHSPVEQDDSASFPQVEPARHTQQHNQKDMMEVIWFWMEANSLSDTVKQFPHIPEGTIKRWIYHPPQILVSQTASQSHHTSTHRQAKLFMEQKLRDLIATAGVTGYETTIRWA